MTDFSLIEPRLCSSALLVRLLSRGIMGESAAIFPAVPHLLLNPLQHLLHPLQLQTGINTISDYLCDSK